ncbi:MAG: orotidine-5'-phosphate decarboxylase [Balneolales bacterium]|nr:orotidine-5'-phosphate decarboxylase [Balneolales bacterium]
MTYLEKLTAAVQSSNSTLCVGLDPNLDLLPEVVKAKFASPEEQVAFFCKMVIDYTCEHCAAYKPNLAFFEALGVNGLAVFREVINHIPNDRIIVADAKRGDISSTADHYKKAFFDQFDVDAITLSPLMGFESMNAFADDETKAMYVLTLTSNPGASDFLKKPFEGFDTMAEYIAHELFERSVRVETHLGMVIGATQAVEAKSVIDQHSHGSLLIPGVGVQGGNVDDLAEALKDHEGIPLINSSRGIIYAGSDSEQWTEEVAKKAKATKASIAKITELYV